MIPKMKLPKGFLAAGVNCGVRRYRPDLALLVSDRPCVGSAVFTTNSMKAAPVQHAMRLFPTTSLRALVVNSGQANAATGKQGLEDNEALIIKVSEVLRLEKHSIVVSSTGVIGVRLDLEKILPSVSLAAKNLNDSINHFALAIMTTDLVPKGMTLDVELSKGTVTLTGAAKGSGMIHPNMATMLGFVVCDVVVDVGWWDRSLKEIVQKTFNMISVDGETSTNDSVIALANGASGVEPSSREDEQKLYQALEKLCTHLAKSIARDGEGATKLIEMTVEGLPNLELARSAARLLTTSPLIKSAIHGEDPNWGRILARLGQAGIPYEFFETLSVQLQQTIVFRGGQPVLFDRQKAREQLRSEDVKIVCDFSKGEYSATAWGCDLTKRYVEINTEYS